MVGGSVSSPFAFANGEGDHSGDSAGMVEGSEHTTVALGLHPSTASRSPSPSLRDREETESP